jgi:GMP synthase PP-ATPase subunit
MGMCNNITYLEIKLSTRFMRKDESKKVEKALAVLGLNLKVVDVTDTFLSSTTKIKNVVTKALGETVHPEEKRKIIGTYSVYIFHLCLRVQVIHSW